MYAEAIEFERVSVSEALWSGAPELESLGPEAIVAREARDEAAALDDVTVAWLAALPEHARPATLARRYPRIANRLCSLWRLVSRCEDYLDDLMFDRRGGRQGFPRDVARDVAALHVYYSTLHPVQRSHWDCFA
jgi:hypothetical protein